MLLIESRSAARRADARNSVLEQQDRTLWDSALIAEGAAIVRACIRRDRPGPYQLQAAIQAVHWSAPTFPDTDWAQIVAIYDHLATIAPTPVVFLNRAIAIGEVDGPDAMLAAVDSLDLDDYHLFHAARGHALRALDRAGEARLAITRAIELAPTTVERLSLEDELATIG
jgi:RNA polymerase sigma-70 factor (ECF subfamily)